MKEKLGIVNKASVYALFDYDAENSDELSFKEGDLLYVKRRGDNDEDKWWWRYQTTITVTQLPAF